MGGLLGVVAQYMYQNSKLLVYHVVPQWWIVQKPLKTSGNLPETYRKPTGNLCGRYATGLRQVSEFFINGVFFSKSWNLPKTYQQVPGGFRIIHHWRTIWYVVCFHNWFKLIYGPYGQSNMHSKLDFCWDQPGMKQMYKSNTLQYNKVGRWYDRSIVWWSKDYCIDWE